MCVYTYVCLHIAHHENAAMSNCRHKTIMIIFYVTLIKYTQIYVSTLALPFTKTTNSCSEFFRFKNLKTDKFLCKFQYIKETRRLNFQKYGLATDTLKLDN